MFGQDCEPQLPTGIASPGGTLLAAKKLNSLLSKKTQFAAGKARWKMGTGFFFFKGEA